jgi:hypothetical protein
MPDDTLAALHARLDRLEALIAHRVPQVFDPSPDDPGRGIHFGWGRPIPIPWPQPGDPVPIDISRLSKAQLQVTIESIKAQRIRLDAVEQMIHDQIKKTK